MALQAQGLVAANVGRARLAQAATIDGGLAVSPAS